MDRQSNILSGLSLNDSIENERKDSEISDISHTKNINLHNIFESTMEEEEETFLYKNTSYKIYIDDTIDDTSIDCIEDTWSTRTIRIMDTITDSNDITTTTTTTTKTTNQSSSQMSVDNRLVTRQGDTESTTIKTKPKTVDSNSTIILSSDTSDDDTSSKQSKKGFKKIEYLNSDPFLAVTLHDSKRNKIARSPGGNRYYQRSRSAETFRCYMVSLAPKCPAKLKLDRETNEWSRSQLCNSFFIFKLFYFYF
jgi:hypothetical protein